MVKVGKIFMEILMIIAQSFQYKEIQITITRDQITKKATIQYQDIKMSLEDMGMPALVSLAKSSIEGEMYRDLYNSSY